MTLPNLRNDDAGYLDQFTRVGDRLYFRNSYYDNTFTIYRPLYTIDPATGNVVQVAGTQYVEYLTNVEDPKDTFTVAPVNRYGFPQGEGRTEEEKGGPYTFVLATVKHVHFDEDDRYYTVVRADTGTEQRADSGK